MATYVSISADLPSAEDMIAIIDSLLQSKHFGVVSVCSYHFTKDVTELFLSGYGVETTLIQIKRWMQNTSSRVTAVAESNINSEYLFQIEQAIPEHITYEMTSPFERVTKEYTFINHHMQLLDLSTVRSWIDERKVARVFVYLCALNVAAPEEFPFRHRFLDWGYKPVIELELIKHPKMGFKFILYSASQVWLQNSFDPTYDGLPSADQNLRILGELVEYTLLPININDAIVSLSGSVFHNESDRFKHCMQQFNVSIEIT